VTIFKYRETRTYPTRADEVFSYCLDALRTIGVELDKQDRDLGVLEASFYPKGLFAPGRVGIWVVVTPDGDGAAEAAIETYLVPTRSFFESYLGARDPEKVARRILSRVDDASAMAEAMRDEDGEGEGELAVADPLGQQTASMPPREGRCCPSCQAANSPTESRCLWCGGPL
jgi:hypothetical protein